MVGKNRAGNGVGLIRTLYTRMMFSNNRNRDTLTIMANRQLGTTNYAKFSKKILSLATLQKGR